VVSPNAAPSSVLLWGMPIGGTPGFTMNAAKPYAVMIAALFFIFSAPFTKFIASRGYGFLHPEVGFVFLWLLLGALALGGLMIAGPRVLRPVLIAVPVFVFLYIEALKAMPRFLEAAVAAMGGIWATFAAGVVVFVAVFSGLYRKVGREIFSLLTIGFATVSCVVLATSGKPAPMWESRAGPPVRPDPALPALVHVVLDGQIGIDGLPARLAEGRGLRTELRRFYVSRGFRVFPRAFSHFPLTQESITNTLNGEVDPVAYKDVRPFRNGVTLKRNAWFKELAARGYSIDVIQSRFYDLCGTGAAASAPVSRCLSYSHADLRFFHGVEATAWQKAKLLFRHHLEVDLLPPLMPALLFYEQLRDAGFPLPALGAYRSVSASSLAALAAMERLGQRLGTLRRGEAVFAHILLPHAPFMLDRHCSPMKEVRRWAGRSNLLWAYGVTNTPEEWARRYQAYFAQSRCAHARLGRILDLLSGRPGLEDAVIVIHGDHGSKIVEQEPYARFRDEITARDIIDSYSTLFAVKVPGLGPGELMEQRSIQGLFAEFVMGKRIAGDHGDVFLQPNRGVVGPNQVRVRMVPLGPVNGSRATAR